MASVLHNADLDLGSNARVINALDGVNPQDYATVAQLNANIEGLAWKDSARVSTQANLTLSAPGATIDGITMAANDRILVRNQTSQPENGIYIWNGAATPATRALDMSTAPEFEAAVVTVEEGTNAGGTFRQTAVNVTVGTTNIVWTAFGTSAPAASETTAGIAELATQAETDTGTDDLRIVTPLKLATWSGRPKRFSQTIGDGSATSIAVTHNLGTKDVQVEVTETGGSERTVVTEVRRTSTNAVTILTNTAPASNAYRVTVLA
ncbi:MAG: hypothetical protein ACRCZI_12200 [Cetobacterium sp.]